MATGPLVEDMLFRGTELFLDGWRKNLTGTCMYQRGVRLSLPAVCHYSRGEPRGSSSLCPRRLL